MRRVGFALAALAAAFAALAHALELGRLGGLAGAPVVFVGVLAAGAPLLYLCCQRRWWAPWQTMLLGAFLGLFVALPFAGGPFSFVFLLAILVLAGAALGGLFWCLGVWRNEALVCPKFLCLPCGTVYRVARHALKRPELQSK